MTMRQEERNQIISLRMLSRDNTQHGRHKNFSITKCNGLNETKLEKYAIIWLFCLLSARLSVLYSPKSIDIHAKFCGMLQQNTHAHKAILTAFFAFMQTTIYNMSDREIEASRCGESETKMRMRVRKWAKYREQNIYRQSIQGNGRNILSSVPSIFSLFSIYIFDIRSV